MTLPPEYRSLCNRLGLDGDLPWSRNWSAAADFLQLLADEVAERRPATVLECGSGLSTLVLARALERAGGSRLVSLESGESFARASRQALQRHGLEAEVIHAPLVSVSLGEGEWRWYDPARLPQMEIDLLVIDGPPGFLQPLSRYPALPLLARRLRSGARILLDDAAREDERTVVARWLEAHPTLRHRYLELERGCSILDW